MVQESCTQAGALHGVADGHEQCVKTVPYTVCRMVPHTVKKCVPYTVCEMVPCTYHEGVPYTVCKQVPYTVKYRCPTR